MIIFLSSPPQAWTKAAAFFSTYECFKKNLPLSDRLAPVKHMISASVGEVVRNISRGSLAPPFTRASLLHPRLHP